MVRQMKLWHEKGYNDAERNECIPHIHSNLMEAMVKLCRARQKYNYSFTTPVNEEHEALVLEAQPDSLEKPIILSRELLDAISSLWHDPAIQQAMLHRKEFQLNDSTDHFMSRLEAIQDPKYSPDEKDVLRVQIRTTSITEYAFPMEKANFRIVDVGGQRTERRKWIHCFEGVNYVFYVASLADYNQPLMEDLTVNRMTESLELFRVLLQEQALESSAVILFLNKTDLFKKEIKTYDLKDYFPGYNGPKGNAEKAQDFIVELYNECNKNKRRRIFHLTCAVDTEQFQKVFKIVRFHILDTALRQGTVPVE